MKHACNAADLLGRILIVAFFLPAGIGKIGGYAGTAAYMAAHGVPEFLLPLVIILEIVGSLALLFGWQTRIAAFLLAGFTILAVLIFHLHPTGGAAHIIQMSELAVAGGLLVIAARGAAGWSVDARRAACSGTS